MLFGRKRGRGDKGCTEWKIKEMGEEKLIREKRGIIQGGADNSKRKGENAARKETREMERER